MTSGSLIIRLLDLVFIDPRFHITLLVIYTREFLFLPNFTSGGPFSLACFVI